MQLRLRIEKHNVLLFEGTYAVADSESFGIACADVFDKLRERRVAQAPNIGEVFEELNSYALDELVGAQISLSEA